MPPKKTKQTKREKRQRQERRFVPQAASGARVVWGLGWFSGLVLGAGAWGYLYARSFAEDDKLRAVPSYLVAAGAVLMGVAIWIGTSSEAPVRVGDPGIAIEKGELRRMAWWAVEKIAIEASAALVVTGKDEANVDWSLRLPLSTHADAIGWILREARERIPRRVEIPESEIDGLAPTAEHAGQLLDLEPLQVVGKRCAATGKTISYEPDARVCTRCERVYAKSEVPKKCKCGNSLAHFRPKDEDASGSLEPAGADGAEEERA